MKKALKISAIVLVSILLVLILLPLLFKGTIKEKVEREINQNLNATVTFAHVGLSLFRNFPDMTLTLRDLVVVGKEPFSKDTLASLPSISLTLNLMSVIRGNAYEVKELSLVSPRILLKVLEDGKVNWDITKESATTDTTASASNFRVLLNKIQVEDGELVYDDAETPMKIEILGLKGNLGGDMTADVTTLDVDASTVAFNVDYDGVSYMRNASVKLVTSMSADLAKWVFTFRDADASINGLNLKANGTFAMPEDGYDMDITFAAADNNFKSFLSLVPAIYSKDFESLKTDGTMSLKGFVKGKYSDLSIPAFGVDIQVKDGMFSYPALPGKVSEVNLTASISNPDGVTDHTVIDVAALHLKLMQNPIDAAFRLITPVSDPAINGKMKGMLNLADISKIYPLGAGEELSGTINCDISLDGRMSSLENGRYQEFKAAGFAVADKVSFSGPKVAQKVNIRTARLDFSPAFISLTGMDMNLGKNDLRAEGRIENYLPYFLKDNAILKGSLSLNSNLMDLNAFMKGQEPKSTEADSTSMQVIEIPGNLEFTLQSSYTQLIYEQYQMKDVTGVVRIKDQALILDGLNVGILGGSIGIKGTYNTVNPKVPKVNMEFNVKDVQVKDAFRTFNMVKTFAPVTERLNGKVTTMLRFNGDLKENMMPELTSLTGAGLVLSDILSVENLNTFNAVADVLKIEKLRKPAIEKVNLSFDLVDGKATIKPMEFKLGGYKSNFGGTIGLDQAIDFVLNLEIPRSDFGDKANGVLNNMVSDAARKGLNLKLGDLVPVTLLIGGTVQNPKVSAGIKQAMASVVEDIKQQAMERVQQKKEEVVQKAREEANKLIDQANAQAARILQLAQQQSDQVMNSARIGADKVKRQADSTAAKVMAEGKKNGMIAEIAAKKTAEKLKKEADLKATKLLDEARLRSDAILNKAREEAEKVKQQAQSRVN